ncbi:P-loop containing nucleoside triphosphate hydrolase protein [Trametes meyenii]|nr:P-loop containing nucleoside triphosphate hydrolase protein [Trametes meyenii]
MTHSASLCPDTLYGNGCEQRGCPFQHDARLCSLCAIICSPASSYANHQRSKGHQIKLSRATHLHCKVCNVQAQGHRGWTQHVAGDRHRKRATRLGFIPENVEPLPPPPSDPRYKCCDVCDFVVHVNVWQSHLIGTSHKRHQRHAALRAAFERAESDKQGVDVSHSDAGVDFGVVSLAASKKGLCIDVSVQVANLSDRDVVLLGASITTRRKSHSSLGRFTVDASGITSIPSDGPVLVPVRFRHDQRGRYEAWLELTFQGKNNRPFTIARTLRVVIGETADRETLKPVAPFVRRRRAPWRDGVPVLSGDPPPSLPAPWVVGLPASRIPSDLTATLKKGSPEDILARVRQHYFLDPLSLDNHSTFFGVLLWLEEFRMTEDLRMYDKVDVEVVSEGRLHTLHVDGLAEKRPSLNALYLPGDTIKLQTSADAKETHQGIVHDVRAENVRLSFHRSFNGTGTRFNVCFSLNRTPLKRQHQALKAPCPASRSLLFPLPGHEGLASPLSPNETVVTLYNASIGNNTAQLQAVRSILSLRESSAPFIVFGPPGTGKTVTIVEAIRQILLYDPNARILACAPSNSAADIIAQRLTMLGPDELFRCNAACREPLSVPADLTPYVLARDGFYVLPPMNTLVKYKVIVSTCGNASFVYNIGMLEGHFSHIFVDEAGQASEPEVLSAIKTIAVEKTRVVLSGDPKQLGPVIRSAIARELGLSKSYLERLMERPVYAGENGRGTCFIKLVNNYRSHEAILTYPNEQFYSDELEVHGPAASINSFIGSSQLVNANFPVVFHGISGKNERESTSPSYFNIDEATQVKAYVLALLDDHDYPVRARDIGIIAPYHAQVRKIRKLLQLAQLSEVKVGSVEEFQGQERRAIIVSTVRSSAELLDYDAKFTLGFVSNPRRFNVAVTRAQALLIVVGDASVLCIDPLWRGFMNFIYHHQGWRGDPPAWDVNAPVCSDVDYAKEIREAAATEIDAFIARAVGGDDVEGEANIERAFQVAD